MPDPISSMKLTAIGLLLLFFVFSASQSIVGQTSRDLSELRVSISADREPLGKIFRRLMGEHGIDIGFEQSTLDNNKWYFSFDTNMPFSATHSSQKNGVTVDTTAESAFNAGPYPISINIQNGTVREVFDTIIRQMDHYTWESRDGVINIFPTKGRDPRFESLLDVNIADFRLPKGSKVEDITMTLLNLPEFRQFQRSNRISFFPVRDGVTVLIKAQYGRTIDEPMEFKNIRFHDLLNRITRIKKGGWILRMRGKTREGGERGDLDI